ncbi:MAG: hypothetical protein GVY28_01700 [Alphaproteobacteria bacterium]|nr:hypothetical protein [Alphaproteobacteria bacterium]
MSRDVGALVGALISLRLWLIGVVAGVGAAGLLYLGLTAAAWATAGVPQTLLAERLLAADPVRLGAVDAATQYRLNTANDCIFAAGLIADYPSRVAEAISLLRLAERPSPEIAAMTHCGRLIAAAEGRIADGDDARTIPTTAYHQYLFGYRPLVAAALVVMPYDALRTGLAATAWLGLAALGWMAWRRARTEAEPGHLVWAGMALALALGFGIAAFGGRPTHAFWGLAVIGMLIYGCRRAGRLSDRGPVVAAAVFGAVIAQSEFLLGAAPMGLAMVIVLPALMARRADGETAAIWRTTAAASIAFTVAVAASFGLKIAVLGVLTEDWGVAAFVEAMTGRMGGSPWSEIDTAMLTERGIRLDGVATYAPLSILSAGAKLAWSSASLSFGSHVLAIGLWGAAAIAFVPALRRLAGGSAQERAVALASILSVMVVAVWFALFLNHAIVHSRFMVRLLAWPVTLSFGLVALACAEDLARAPWLAPWLGRRVSRRVRRGA